VRAALAWSIVIFDDAGSAPFLPLSHLPYVSAVYRQTVLGAAGHQQNQCVSQC